MWNKAYKSLNNFVTDPTYEKVLRDPISKKPIEEVTTV